MGTAFVVSIFVLLDAVLFLTCTEVARWLVFVPASCERFAGFTLAFAASFTAIMVCVPPWAQFVNGTLDPLHHILFFGPILVYGAASAATAWSSSGRSIGKIPIAGLLLSEKAAAVSSVERVLVLLCVRRVLLSAALMLTAICAGMAAICCLGEYGHEGSPTNGASKETVVHAAHGTRFLVLSTLFHTQSPFWERTPFRLSDLIGLEVMLSSFREHNRRDTIEVLVDDDDDGLRRLARHYDAHLWSYLSVWGAPPLVNGNIRRWQLISAWSSRNGSRHALAQYRGFLILDATDIAFQRDPFAEHRLWTSSAELHLMHDVNSIMASQSAYFRKMATPCFGVAAVNQANASPVNGGLIGGRVPERLPQLARMLVDLAFECGQASDASRPPH